jgi:uncharacterized repeat protein (TIGR03803 family)
LFIDSTFYGTTLYGGMDNVGVIYRYDLANLQIQASGGTLTCANSTINVDVTSNISGVNYSWTGPEGFISSTRNPEVNIPGNYIVTVTYGSLSKSDTVVVTKNKDVPDFTTSISGSITCNVFSVILSASSSVVGVSFNWTGPVGYTSSQPITTTTIPGNYTVTVFNPLNGCSSTDTITVQQNIAEPENVTATVENMLTCVQTGVTLTGSSTTTGVRYNWSGPDGFSSMEQNPEVTDPGVYSLMVTDTTNNCSSSASVLVEKDTTYPIDVIATVSGVLTCTDTTVSLTGSSGSGEVTYSWLDPTSTNLAGNLIEVSIPGTYILTVTSTVSGCSESANINVEQDIEAPANLTTSVSDTLSCTVTSVILSTSSSTPGVTYRWEGPQDFTSNEQFTLTGIPGNYNVTATNPNNGCTSVKQVTVIEEKCQ